MTTYEVMDILGKAFADGEVDALAPHIAKNCVYSSEYANKRFETADEIIERMKYVYSNIDENSRYTYSIVRLDEISNLSDVENLIVSSIDFELIDYGLYLYQYDNHNPVSIVIAAQNANGKICRILLSRDTKVFDMKFYGEVDEDDSPYDLPSTVTPLTPNDRQVKEMQNAFSGQHLEDAPQKDEDNIYIWRQADLFIKDWLKNNGYYVNESRVFDDCVGYRCKRYGLQYTVYMFAYGRSATVYLDGEYCKKFENTQFSENSTVLIVFLHVKRYRRGNEIEYKIFKSGESENPQIELWKLNKVSEKTILQYFTREEMMGRIKELIYAFNHDSLDVYDCIICDSNPSFLGYGESGYSLNSAFYSSLKRLHDKYGDMKLGYVRYNDVVYSAVPYIEDYGFFGFKVNNENQIHEIYSSPFNGGERPVEEFIYTDEKEDEDMYSHYPCITHVSTLPPVETERFAIKVVFDNGEVKKYVLPIEDDRSNDEAIKYRNHVFTDKIWQSAKVVDKLTSEDNRYPNRGQSIIFKNEFFISAYLCYEKGVSYIEPVVCNETVYDDENYKLNRLWRWNVNSVYEDEETGVIRTLVSGTAFNYYGVSTFGTRDGKRLTSLDFDYMTSFSEGFACVAISGKGYGFVDETGKIVIPTIYENADSFQNGKAKVKRNGNWFYIDKTGKEIEFAPDLERKYQEVGEISEGLCKVSTLKLRFMDLAYHSDYENIAGVWGYVDENGNEVISPQYIYANDFENGIAIVCKGKWTIDKKWDNECNTGRYWTEVELWGAIDKNGNEVIPFVFDEIKYFNDTTDVFMAHHGGWEEGKWGVISRTGEWLADPVFEDIDYEYQDGLFAFYKEDKWGDDVPLGIYDIHQHKVIFEPQFYDVSFRDDGYLEVEVFDEKLARRIEKIIDLTGTELFPSIYSSIHGWKEPYEVVIRDENGSRHGLIDKNGNILLPCKYDVSWNGISYEKKLIIVSQDGKQAMVDFDDNVIIPAKYYEIYGLNNPLLTVRDGEKDNYKEGLVTYNGTVVIPPNYHRISWCKEGRIICCNDGNCEMLELIIKHPN